MTVTTVDDGHGVTVAPTSLGVDADDTGSYTVVLDSEPGGTGVITPASGDEAVATVSGPLTFTNGAWSVPERDGTGKGRGPPPP
ncbi:MAG: hypothetical protein OXC96_03400 [Cyanobacteria bacterium MAG CAR1_bin_15]|nr:hypothetical protein [Cyanobacteria bacterium MAG CAR1_bin_15]